MDPFRTLGVSRDASEADIKAAFRNAALKHHPDVHATAPEAVRKEAEVLFRAVNEAYQSLTDGSYRYRQSSAPGRAGFHRGGSAHHTSYSSYYYQGSQGGSYSGYAQYRRRGGFNFSRFSSSAFVVSGSMLITAVLGGVALAGVLIMDPLATSLWQRANQGKSWNDVEEGVAQRRREHFAQMQAAREAREALAAAERALLRQQALQEGPNVEAPLLLPPSTRPASTSAG